MKIQIEIPKDIVLILKKEYPSITKKQITEAIELFLLNHGVYDLDTFEYWFSDSNTMDHIFNSIYN